MLFGPTQVWYDELNYLEERKICEICSETMSSENQRMLPCQHTFCLEPCLRIITNFQTKKVHCPFQQCKKSHNIPDLGIKEFPRNLILNNLLEIIPPASNELFLCLEARNAAHTAPNLDEKFEEAFLFASIPAQEPFCGICKKKILIENHGMLPCQHTYCTWPCLKSVTNLKTKKVTCPFQDCYKSYHIPDNGIRGFPKNSIIFNLLDTIDTEYLFSDAKISEIDALVSENDSAPEPQDLFLWLEDRYTAPIPHDVIVEELGIATNTLYQLYEPLISSIEKTLSDDIRIAAPVLDEVIKEADHFFGEVARFTPLYISDGVWNFNAALIRDEVIEKSDVPGDLRNAALVPDEADSDENSKKIEAISIEALNEALAEKETGKEIVLYFHMGPAAEKMEKSMSCEEFIEKLKSIPVKYQLSEPLGSAPVSGKEIMKYETPAQSIVSEESRKCLSRAITFYKRTRKSNFPALKVAPTALVSKNDKQGGASFRPKFMSSSIRRLYNAVFGPSNNEEHRCSYEKMTQENQPEPSESKNKQPGFVIYRNSSGNLELVMLNELYS